MILDEIEKLPRFAADGGEESLIIPGVIALEIPVALLVTRVASIEKFEKSLVP
jgi:hypothetical protein